MSDIQIFTRKWLWVCVVVGISLLSCQSLFANDWGAKLAERKDVILFNNFDSDAGKHHSIASQGIVSHGGSFVSGGSPGYALQLLNSSYAEIETHGKLNTREGAISFWVKPLWPVGDKHSHTFLTMKWANSRQGYMAISQGWWEPEGANRLYFVVNNQDLTNCSTPYVFDVGVWSKITVTWKSGREGHCRVFVNDEKVIDSKMPFVGGYASMGSVFIGTDKGSTEQMGRSATALFDDLVVYNKALSETEVLASYKNQKNNYVPRYTSVLEARGGTEEKGVNGNEIKFERRVIFDESATWALSKENTDKILTRIKKAGFNTYIPCVWHGKGTYYPSALAQPESRLERQIARGYDPLAYLIEKAHSMGIEVHPWFTVVRREDSTYPDYQEGAPTDAFDVHNEHFRKFIVDLMLDVVKRYRVDGINLDYIRSMGFCSSDRCSLAYLKKYNRSLLMDTYLRKIPGNKIASLETWNLDAVTDIVRDFSTQAKMRRPNLVISVDAHPLNPDLLLQGQDSVMWANNGWIDVIFNMDYGKRIDVGAAELVRKALKEPSKMTMLLATFDQVDGKVMYREPDVISYYINTVRQLLPDSGIAFYQYPQLSNDQIQELHSNTFKMSAEPIWPSRMLNKSSPINKKIR